MNNEDEITGFKFFRVAYSYDPCHQGWCIFQQENTELSFIDGPWISENDAKDEMKTLNEQQGLNLGGNK